MDVLEIFNGIQKQVPSKLLMIGDGPEKNKAEKKAKKLGIKDKVIFFGNFFYVLYSCTKNTNNNLQKTIL